MQIIKMKLHCRQSVHCIITDPMKLFAYLCIECAYDLPALVGSPHQLWQSHQAGYCSKWNGMCNQEATFTSKDRTKATEWMFSEFLFIPCFYLFLFLRLSSVLVYQCNKCHYFHLKTRCSAIYSVYSLNTCPAVAVKEHFCFFRVCVFWNEDSV